MGNHVGRITRVSGANLRGLIPAPETSYPIQCVFLHGKSFWGAREIHLDGNSSYLKYGKRLCVDDAEPLALFPASRVRIEKNPPGYLTASLTCNWSVH